MYLTEDESIVEIKYFFKEHRKKYIYVNQKGNHVTCKMSEDGIEVDCLSDIGSKNFLPWGVFWQAVNVMRKNKGSAIRGSFSGRLGSTELPFDSIEGRVANVIYGKVEGDSVFRRVSPIAYVLIDSGICVRQRGKMQLARKQEREDRHDSTASR